MAPAEPRRTAAPGGFDPYRYYLAGRGQRRSWRAFPRLVGSALGLARQAGAGLFAAVLASQVVVAVLLGAQVLFGKLAIQAILEQSQPGGSFGPVVLPLVGLAVVGA